MARPTIAVHHTQCSDCGKDMPPVKHKRPFAKMCHDCRGEKIGVKGDLSSITEDLKRQHALSGMDKIFAREDWSFLNLGNRQNLIMHKARKFG